MTYSAKQAINLHVKNVPHHIRQAFEERAARMMCRAHDPFDILKAWEGRSDPELQAQWEMYVTVTKARMVGHFEAEVIRDARFEIEAP